MVVKKSSSIPIVDLLAKRFDRERGEAKRCWRTFAVIRDVLRCDVGAKIKLVK